MFEWKKRPKVEVAPQDQEALRPLKAVPPDTEGIVSQLNEAEQSMGDMIEVCSVCFKHGCYAAPSIWVRADDSRVRY